MPTASITLNSVQIFKGAECNYGACDTDVDFQIWDATTSTLVGLYTVDFDPVPGSAAGPVAAVVAAGAAARDRDRGHARKRYNGHQAGGSHPHGAARVAARFRDRNADVGGAQRVGRDQGREPALAVRPKPGPARASPGSW